MLKPAWTIETCMVCRASKHMTLDDKIGTLTCPTCGTRHYPSTVMNVVDARASHQIEPQEATERPVA